MSKSYLTELAPLLFPLGAKDEWMAVLVGYFDDSGTHKDSRYVVVAGAIASVNQWERLATEWKRLTDSWNLTRGYFHMADFVSGYNDYTGWTGKEKSRRLLALIKIIHANIGVLVGNSVVQADFQAAYERCPCKAVGNAYRFCAFLTLPAVDNWRRRSHRRAPVALIFESGNKLMNEYGKILAKMGSFEHSRERYGIASVTEGSKKEMPQLQAADVIAYAAYKCLSQRNIENYLTTAFSKLFSKRQEGLLHSDASTIEKYLRQICEVTDTETDANAKGKAAQ